MHGQEFYAARCLVNRFAYICTTWGRWWFEDTSQSPCCHPHLLSEWQKRKKGVTCRTSLIESHQGRWEKAGGVGSDTQKCGYMRLTACSTPFSSTKHRDVLHNGHHLYISRLSSWKGFRPHSAWSHCWVLQSFGATMTPPIKWFKSLCDIFTFIPYTCMYVQDIFTSYCGWNLSIIYGWLFVGK